MTDLSKAVVSPGEPRLRTAGYFMRLQVEDLVGRTAGEVGLRRATQAAAMIEVAYTSYGPAKEKEGFFNAGLCRRIARRLRTAHLEPAESRFRDIFAWDRRDRNRIRHEMRANLMRLLKDPPTDCLRIGIELHVLWTYYAIRHFGDEYKAVFDPRDALQYHELHRAIVDIGDLFALKAAA